MSRPEHVRRRYIPHRSDNPYPLGRHEHHDPQSKQYPFTAPRPVQYKDQLWTDVGPVLNQGSIGGCVGWTGADMLNTAAFDQLRAKVNGGAYFQDAEGLRLYELATRDDGLGPPYPPDDRGSSGLGLARAMRSQGLIGYYTHAFGFQHFCAAIEFQPVAVGTLWTQDMFQPDAGTGLVHAGNLSDQGNIAGGHEYMVRGIDYERQQVRARNHWTPEWGLDGEFLIGFDDFEQLLAANGDVMVLHPPS